MPDPGPSVGFPVEIDPVTGKHAPSIHDPESGITITVRYVTPIEARDWLDRDNELNRDEKSRQTLGLAAEINAGRFLVNGDTVRWMTTTVGGQEHLVLADGQHRLRACVIAGKPIRCILVRGITREAQRTIDVGIARTFSDVVTIERAAGSEIAGVEKGSDLTLGAITRRAMAWDQGIRVIGGSVKYSHGELFEFLAENNAALNLAARRASALARHCGLSRAIVGMAYWLFSGVDADQCERFFEQLSGGAAASGSVLLLRNRIFSWKDRGYRPKEAEVIYFLVRIWNAFRTDEVLLRLLPPKAAASPGLIRSEHIPDPI